MCVRDNVFFVCGFSLSVLVSCFVRFSLCCSGVFVVVVGVVVVVLE